MTRRIIKIVFLAVCFTSSCIISQTVSSFEISGNTIFSVKEYKGWIRINSGTKIFKGIEDTIKSRISNELKARGYYHSDIHLTVANIDSAQVKFVLSLNENSPTIINKIEFNSEQKDSVFLAERFSELSGIIFNGSNIEYLINNVLTEMENSGYPFASIKIESVYFYSDSLDNQHYADIYIAINKETLSRINRIEISGNTKTQDRVITRSLGIVPGELYDQRKIDEIPVRLNRLIFFEPVEKPDFFLNTNNEGILKITIKEKETNNFDGVIGYVPSTNDNEKGFFTGYINIGLRNLFGTGRTAAIKWLQENRNSQEFELRYLEPWLFDFPFNIEGGLFQRKQDSTYIQRTLEGRLEYLASEDISASIIFNTQSTIPSERNIKVFTVYNSSAVTTGVNFKIDTRDDFYAPTNGIVLINSYKFTAKSINGPHEFITPLAKTKVNFQRLELDFHYFEELFSGQIAALGIHARELRGSETELSDLYLLGGNSTLRGYREKQFQGNRILWSNLEYRYLLTRQSYAFLFFDSGYYLRNENIDRSIPELSGFKIGYGLGITIETGLGILGVSFALAKGDSFGDGKIHFGIINEF